MMITLQPDHCMTCTGVQLAAKPAGAHVQDAQSVAWLERTLAAFKGTVVAVTHDRCVARTYIPPRVSPTCIKLECCACLSMSSEAACAAEHAGRALRAWCASEECRQSSQSSSYMVLFGVFGIADPQQMLLIEFLDAMVQFCL